MKAKPYRMPKISDQPTSYGWIDCEPDEADHLLIRLPGPSGRRFLPVQLKGTREGTGNWTWNGDVESPTLKPSLLITGGCRISATETTGDYRCHTWITDGKAQFLPDSNHSLTGQTLDLIDLGNDNPSAYTFEEL